ncbi:unnamed protein product, partial [Vicia faba]
KELRSKLEFAHELPFQKICVITKIMFLIISLRRNHLFLSCQGTKISFEKVRTTMEESLSIKSFNHALSLASSIALKTTENSACKELETEVGSAKANKIIPREFQKISPQPLEVFSKESSQLHLIQFKAGGCQRTSIILRVRG